MPASIPPDPVKLPPEMNPGRDAGDSAIHQVLRSALSSVGKGLGVLCLEGILLKVMNCASEQAFPRDKPESGCPSVPMVPALPC